MADFTMDRFSLKGKTALVTGAERGIGLEIAKGLAAAGANIIIAGLMEEEFPKAKAAVRAKGVSCTVLKADISKEEDVLRLAEQAWEIFPNGLDILVNNAGVNKLAPAEEMPLEVWQKVVGVNLTGTFLMCRTFGNRMLQQGHGNIVNVASMSGLVVNPLPQQQCAYNSSKAGVIMLTKCMANEWAQRGVRVNAICPGFTDTPLTARRLSTPNDPAVAKWLRGSPSRMKWSGLSSILQATRLRLQPAQSSPSTADIRACKQYRIKISRNTRLCVPGDCLFKYSEYGNKHIEGAAFL